MDDLFGSPIKVIDDVASANEAASPYMGANKHSDAGFDYVGHQPIISHINHMLASHKLPHALCFSGEQGIGKATLAKSLAHSLLKAEGNIQFVTDDVHMRMDGGSHPDYLYISNDQDEKKKQKIISVDQIRKISAFLSKTAAESTKRVVLIDGADTMNNNAANALLKNLEEPPAGCIIILVTHNQASMLPTIRSRVQMVEMSPLNHSDCMQVLHISAPEALMDMSQEDLSLLVDLADGKPGQALIWLEHGAIDIYRQWLTLLAANTPEARQLYDIGECIARLTKERSAGPQKLQLLASLIQLSLKRAAYHPAFSDTQEQEAMERWRQLSDPQGFATSWPILGRHISLAASIHLDYKQVLTTMMLRLMRGQQPLDII